MTHPAWGSIFAQMMTIRQRCLQSETMLLESAMLTESGRPILSHPGEVESLMQDKVPDSLILLAGDASR